MIFPSSEILHQTVKFTDMPCQSGKRRGRKQMRELNRRRDPDGNTLCAYFAS
jgi:hypothetical protein